MIKKIAFVFTLALVFVSAIMLILPSGAAADETIWAQMETGTDNWLLDIWGSSPNDIFAVGTHGTILHYDGSNWSPMNSWTTDSLYGIWGSSADDIFIVGWGKILHFNGSDWNTMPCYTKGAIYGIWGSSGTDVFAGYGNGDIYHYDGYSWVKMDNVPQKFEINDIWGTSSDNVWAVGCGADTILHYDGNQWTEVDTPVSPNYATLYAIWGAADDDIFAVGSNSVILHYDGIQWNWMGAPASSHYPGLWGSSGSDVFAAGFKGTIIHYDGDSWSRMNSGTSKYFRGIWGSSGTDVYAVNQGGEILHYGSQRYEVTGDWEVTSIDGAGTFSLATGEVTSGAVTVGVDVTGDISGEFDFVCKFYPDDGEGGGWYGTSASISGTVTVDGMDHPATLWLKGYFNSFELTGFSLSPPSPPTGWNATLGCPPGETHGWTTDGSQMAADFGWTGACSGNVSADLSGNWTTNSGNGLGTWDGISNTCLAGKTEYKGSGTGNVSLPMSPEEVSLDYNMTEDGDFIMARYDSNPGSMPGTRHILSRFVQVDSSVVDPEIDWGAMGLSIEYTDEEITASIINKDTLALYWWNSGSNQWEQVPGSWANPEENYVTGSLMHFSSYSIQGDPLNIYSCDDEGNPKDVFDAGESMYVAGSGLDPETDYKLWLQPPGMQENGTLSAENDFSEAQEVVTTNDVGNFDPVEIWDIFDGLDWGQYAFSIVADNLASGTEGYYHSVDDELDSVNVNGLVVYVDITASGSNNGTSWDDAYENLQDALMNIPGTPCQVWVASGTYTPVLPGSPGSRYDSFQMQNGVEILGGFFTYAGSIEDRDWEANPAILSGDLGTLGATFDNCYHVVFNSGSLNLTNTAVLDGFVISGGYADGGGYESCGAGMFNSSGSPTIANCTFAENLARQCGGGMYNESGASPEIADCNFANNTADYGGGILNVTNCEPIITRCSFSNNVAVLLDSHKGYGAGICNMDSSPIINDCTFTANSAGEHGGAIHNRDDFSPYNAPVDIIDCTFTGNTAGRDGGAIDTDRGDITIVNCLFNGNEADSDNNGSGNGGAICQGGATITNCTLYGNSANIGGAIYQDWDCPTITNCIFWANSANTHNTLSLNSQSNCVTFEYSLIPGGWGDPTNIGGTPMFVDPGNGDFHLLPCSPAIDAGYNSAPELPNYDFEGDDRILDGNQSGTPTVDLGVDEAATIRVDIFMDLQGANRPPEGWEVPINIGFYETGKPNSWLLNPGSAICHFSGTTSAVSTVSGTRAYFACPANPGTYNITADSATTLLNVKRGVSIW